jgi:hypothetical protein
VATLLEKKASVLILKVEIPKKRTWRKAPLAFQTLETGFLQAFNIRYRLLL